jgi:hypothetical protein
MKNTSFFIIIGFLLLCVGSVISQTNNKFSLNGIVKNSVSSGSIQGAKIKISTNKNGEILTDSMGFFTFNLSAGIYKIEITHVGYAKKMTTVNLTKDVTIEVELVSQTIDLEEFTVKSTTNKTRVQSAQMGTEVIDRKMALTIPAILGEVDIIKVLQLKPGVKNSGEGTSGISVRGGGTDQNLFLIDGTTVYNPNHLFGFFSTFNIDAIKDV